MNEPEHDLPNLDDETSIEVLDALLKDHADQAAERARAVLGAPLDAFNLPRFLVEEGCLRYPTEIVFSNEGVDPNQFAETFFDEGENGRVCRLHIHPRFEGYAPYIPYFVAYMAPVINYGHIAKPELCERYGAHVLGIDEESFYTQLCDIMDTTPY